MEQITDSLKAFGINDKDTCFLCVVLNEDDMELVCSKVKGELVDLTQENLETCDEKELRKIYKIKEEETKIVTLLDAIINRISTKEITT